MQLIEQLTKLSQAHRYFTIRDLMWATLFICLLISWRLDTVRLEESFRQRIWTAEWERDKALKTLRDDHMNSNTFLGFAYHFQNWFDTEIQRFPMEKRAKLFEHYFNVTPPRKWDREVVFRLLSRGVFETSAELPPLSSSLRPPREYTQMFKFE